MPGTPLEAFNDGMVTMSQAVLMQSFEVLEAKGEREVSWIPAQAGELGQDRTISLVLFEVSR